MKNEVDIALAILEKYNLADAGIITLRELELIADGENLIRLNYPLKGRIKERYIRDQDGVGYLTIRSDIRSEADLKHLSAHGLGHHLLHHSGSWMFLSGLFIDKQEIEAEVFAAVLLVPPAGLRRRQSWFGPGEIARAFNIPSRLAETRWRVLEVMGI